MPARKTREKQQLLAHERAELIYGLEDRYVGRYEALRAMAAEIRKLAEENQGLDTALIQDEMGKLDQLLDSFLRMATSRQRLAQYLKENPSSDVERDIVQAQRALRQEEEPRVQASLKQSIALAQKRLGKHEQIEGAWKALSVQMDTLEKSFDYLKSHILGIGTREELAAALDNLVAGVSTVSELDPSVDDDPRAAAGGRRGPGRGRAQVLTPPVEAAPVSAAPDPFAAARRRRRSRGRRTSARPGGEPPRSCTGVLHRLEVALVGLHRGAHARRSASAARRSRPAGAGDRLARVLALAVLDRAHDLDLACGVVEHVDRRLADRLQEGLGCGELRRVCGSSVSSSRRKRLERLDLVGVGNASLIVKRLEIDRARQLRRVGIRRAAARRLARRGPGTSRVGLASIAAWSLDAQAAGLSSETTKRLLSLFHGHGLS